MNNLLSHLVAQFQQFYKNLTPVKRISMLASTVIAAVGVAVVVMMVVGTNYVPLFTDVPPEQLPQIVAELQKEGVPFKLSNNGKTILVSEEMLHATQMAVMTKMGGENVGHVGLELFDKEDFGTTSYAQRINFQRAMQGELMRAINTLSAVRESKVILALPPKQTFLDEGAKPSASVVVKLNPGKELSPEQVRGIIYLVSSAVENLDPDRVTVVDARGKVLSKHYTGDAGETSELMDMKAKIEDDLEQRIESVVSKVVGTGKVIAKVDATLDPQSSIETDEQVNPDGTALKSQQTEEQVLDGARSNPTGIPGSRSNLPGAMSNGSVGFKQNVHKELTTSNYEVPKTVRNIKEAAGNLQRVSVAVLVDGTTTMVKDKNGNMVPQWQPLPQAEMAKLQNIIQGAIGYDAKRGDTVTVENIAFQREDFSQSEQLLTTLQRQKMLRALLKWAVLVASMFMFFFAVVRPFMRWITDSFQDTVEDMLPKTIEELEELQSVDNSLPGMSGALPVLEESLDPDKAESELLKERIMNLMELDSEKAAGAFSLWLSRRDT